MLDSDISHHFHVSLMTVTLSAQGDCRFLDYGLCNLVCGYQCSGGTCCLYIDLCPEMEVLGFSEILESTRLQGAKTQKPEICLDTDDGEDGIRVINVSVNAMSTLIMQETEAISISKVR